MRRALALVLASGQLGWFNFVTIDTRPLKPQQGDTIIVYAILPDTPVATVRWQNREIPMFRSEDNHFHALLGTSPDTPPGRHTVGVKTDREEFPVTFNLQRAKFGIQRLRVPAARNRLRKDPRVDEDHAQIRKVLATPGNEQLWTGPFQWPVKNSIRTQYGLKRIMNGDASYGWHKGYDIRGKSGTPVKAAAEGIVAIVRPCVLEGNTILLQHGHGVFTAYFHLSRFEVAEGQRVRQGDVIARVGNTGISSGPHLHWGVYVNGTAVNPKTWLTAPPR